MPNVLVKLSNVTYHRDARLIFDNVNLSIKEGRITAIMGPSGSGKTTLLRLIGGQLQPDKGTVMVDDKNIHQLSRHHLLHARKKMGLLFQNSALFSHLTVYDNVAFPLREHTTLPESYIRSIVLMKLQAVGLRGAAHLVPYELSGGMARRAALARTIALDPDLLMYDEPFTGQDPISLGVLMRLIKRLNQLLNITTIIVSHDIHETCELADYVYVVSGTKVIGQGTPDVLKNSDDPQIKQFMSGESDGIVPFHYPAIPFIKELINA